MQTVDGRELKIFSCYSYNVPEKIVLYQKKVFDFFNFDIVQELTTRSHPEYLDHKIMSEDFDIIVFFDIDCIPLKPNFYNVIVDKLKDDNSLVGVEQEANHLNNKFVFAGPACLSVPKSVYVKLGLPSFKSTKIADTAGQLTLSAKQKGVNVKLFKIQSSINKKWKCGRKKYGNGTVYDNMLYHQFEIGRYYGHPYQKILEYEFIRKCKEIITHEN